MSWSGNKRPIECVSNGNIMKGYSLGLQCITCCSGLSKFTFEQTKYNKGEQPSFLCLVCSKVIFERRYSM